MIDSLELERIKALSCESVALRLGMTVKQHKTRCCFHQPDIHPSLAFKGGKFRCWSCGQSGDNISLVQKVLHKDFLDACRWLADEHNVILNEYKPKDEKPPKPFDPKRYIRFFEHPWLIPEARKFLFEERKLDPRVVAWCRITSYKDRSGVPWITIPYFDREGNLIGVQNRNLVKGAEPRFRFPYKAETFLYNQPVLNRLHPGDTLYITEGCTDCFAMLSAGKKAIAIPSATLLNPKAAKLLKALDDELSIRFEMVPDSDGPGANLYMQLKEVLPGLVRHQLPPGCKDFSDYYLLTKRNETS